MSNDKVKETTATYKLEPKFIYDINQLDLSKQYTYKDYLLWRFKERVELIKGWIYKMSPAPKRKHQKISGNIFGYIWNFIKSSEKTCQIYDTPFDVRLIKNKGNTNEITTVVQPDICIICDKSKLDDYGCIGAPDLIVEILSLSTSKKDYGVKFDLYQENDVKEYWIVNPELHTIEVYTLIKGKYQLFKEFQETEKVKAATSVLFPKLKINLNEVFKE